MGARRILFISENPPYGALVHGAALRTRATLEALREVGHVTFVPIVRVPWGDDALAATAARCCVADAALYELAPAATVSRLRRQIDARSMDTDGFHIPDADRRRILAKADAADLIWIHHVRLANILKRWRWPRTVLDLDDVQSRYEAARASVLHGARRVRAMWRASLWRRRERLLGERFDDVIVCSQEDRRYVAARCRLHVIPNTFDDSGISISRTPSSAPRFGFIGHMGYPPNQDGVRWFGRYVWPTIAGALPTAELRIIGAEGPEVLRTDGLPGTALGFVKDPAAEMATWTAMIVPIRFGGGTRVKISEAFVRRIPVVATRLGAFGYDAVDGEQLLLADEPPAFAKACVRLVEDPSLAQRLTKAAGELYLAQHSSTAVRQQVIDVAESVLRRG